MKRWLRFDWDAIAGIIAAIIALVLHILHVVSFEALLTIAVVLIALLFIRNLRHEHAVDQMQEDLHLVASGVRSLQAVLKPHDTVLIGPGALSTEGARFSEDASGEMIWFNVCLMMFRPQSLFDVLLMPAMLSTRVSSIQFIIDPKQRELWQAEVQPKIDVCPACDKVKEPIWVPIAESVSVIFSNASTPGKTTALLSFWGEPFMASASGRSVPRYIFHLQSESELVPRLADLVRDYRLQSS